MSRKELIYRNVAKVGEIMWISDNIKAIFKEMFCEMDWKQFIPSLLATFVGIFVPFYIQGRQSKFHRRNDAIRRVNQIIEELSDLKNKILSREDEALNKGTVFINPLRLPIGDGLLKTNEMYLLSDLQKYIYRKFKRKRNRESNFLMSSDWYKMIFEIYSDISTYNILWNKCAEQVFYIRNNFILSKETKIEVSDTNQVMNEQNKFLYTQAIEILNIITGNRTSLVKTLQEDIEILLKILNEIVKILNKKGGVRCLKRD